MRVGTIGDVGKVSRRLQWLRALGMAPIVLLCLGAAGTIVYRVGQWRGNADAARAIAIGDSDDKRRMDAMVGAFNDAFATVEMLRKVAREDNVTGRRARTLLRYLHDASK